MSVKSPVSTAPIAPAVIATVDKGIQDIAANVSKAGYDTGATLTKAGKDTNATIIKAGKDAGAETKRAGEQIEDAGIALVHYVAAEVRSEGKVLSNAEKRIREGKVVDAFWHMGTEPFQHTNENAAAAAQESSLLRTVGAVAASAYGGPGGAAAYASWLTYMQTGDANLALRVGIITGASSAAFGAVGDMPSGTTYQLAQKAVVTGAIGGLAVAAAGGSPEAIKAGFLSAGAMVLVQDGYKDFTKHELNGKSSIGEAYCMTANQACSPPDDAMLKVDSDGNATLDMSKVDATRPAVGIKVDPSKVSWQSEQSPFMTSVSRIPGMQAMAIFHDTWTMSWKNDLLVKASIVPAVVLTYAGTGAPYYDLVQRTAIDKAAQAKLTSTSRAGTSSAPIGATPVPATSSTAPNSASSAVARMAEVTPPSRLDHSVQLPAPARQKTIIASYMCTAADQYRQVFVEEGKRTHDNTVCRVGYLREKGSAYLFGSIRSIAECEDRAAKIVRASAKSGWTCFFGSAQMQAALVQRKKTDQLARSKGNLN